MRAHPVLRLICGGMGLLALAGCSTPAARTGLPTQVPTLQAGMARVWVLRQPGSPGGNIAASDPMVFVNRAPLAQSAQGTAYFHDFPPGTYRFTVQAYGTPANLVDTVQLSPGTEAYVQVEAVPNWEEGSAAGGASFAVLSMQPAEARQYLPLMKYLGER